MFVQRKTTLSRRASGSVALRGSRGAAPAASAVAFAATLSPMLDRVLTAMPAAIMATMLPAMLVAGLASPGVAVAQASLHLRGVIVESNLRSTDHPPMVLR
jgi:hypothetical protein